MKLFQSCVLRRKLQKLLSCSAFWHGRNCCWKCFKWKAKAMKRLQIFQMKLQEKEKQEITNCDWYGKCCNANRHSYRQVLQEEMMETKTRLHREKVVDFTISNEWMESWKSMYEIRDTKLSMEADDVTTTTYCSCLDWTIVWFVQRLLEKTHL